MATQSFLRISEEEYLQLERAAEFRNEFVDGQIFAMSGGSPRHSMIAGSFQSELRLALRGGDCNVFTSDLKVRSPQSRSYVYPDVSVVCNKLEMHPGTDDVVTNPVMIVEVLSPSTAAYDRGKKFALYREIPSLKEYVLVHTTDAHIERFTRGAEATWIFRDYEGLQAAIDFDSIGCAIRLSDLYEKVLLLPE